MESLPLGFRFRPTDEELISHYLRLKINARDSEVAVIPEVDICKREPWDLPGLSVIKANDPEWFFFCPRDRKYPNGHRSNRATDAGYWKATGKDRTIKSRKNGRSNPHLIGKKKTLVFYRGRAPKGERTNWIIHEYHATEKDLDGTSPGQGAFVLCRLFRKPDETAHVSQDDEVEQTGSSPSTSKSSPDDISSDVFQETAIMDMKARKQPAGIKRWLTGQSDIMTPNCLVPVESCTSDLDDHSAEEAATEVYPQPAGDSVFEDSTCEQIDCKVFSPFQSQIQSNLGFYMDSPFGNDFGNAHNGILFQDGTYEQDVSLSDLLEVLQNHDEDSYKGSVSLETSTLGSVTEMSGHVPVLPHGIEERESYNDMAQQQLQMQTPLMSQAQTSISSPKVGTRDMDAVFDDSSQQDTSCPDSIPTSFSGSFHKIEVSNNWTNIAYHGSDLVGGTGIRIRTHQAQNQQDSEKLVAQGIAPRRIRLQTKISPVSVSSVKLGYSSSYSDKEQEAQSNSIKAREMELLGRVGKIREMGAEENTESAKESSLRPRTRTEQDGEMGSCGIRSSALSRIPCSSLSLVYIVSLYLVAILFVVSIGMWLCPEAIMMR